MEGKTGRECWKKRNQNEGENMYIKRGAGEKNGGDGEHRQRSKIDPISPLIVSHKSDSSRDVRP